MSWKNAQREAAHWIDQMQLSLDDIRGKVIDLRPYAHLVRHTGEFRIMVFRAAARNLKARDAAGIVLPDLTE